MDVVGQGGKQAQGLFGKGAVGGGRGVEDGVVAGGEVEEHREEREAQHDGENKVGQEDAAESARRGVAGMDGGGGHGREGQGNRGVGG